MCGIAGIIKKNNYNASSDIKLLLKNIHHRGPDDNGYFKNKEDNIAFGNTRLAIQDLSNNGNQPIISKCKRYVIVFNGEIYNFKEIKQSLKNKEYRSNADTEVLLDYYIEKGPKILDNLKGFFSFAIWDQKEKKLFCARDKFGIKPFYYFKDNKEFIFCSEIKPILKLKKNIKPNLNSINSYLTSEYYENIEKTFFKNIIKLKPGHQLEYCNGKLKQRPYWSFYEKYEKIKLPKNEPDIEDLIYNKIDKAVNYSLISDAKISIAASGGLDSSILYHHVKKNDNSLNKLISFKFENPKYSEEKYVRLITKKFGYNVKFSNITKSYFIKNIEKSIILNEEPFAGLPIISYQKNFEDMTGYKVVLDGTGLDEAHCGYSKYHQKTNQSFQVTQDGTNIGNLISNNLQRNSNNYDYELQCKFKNNLKSAMFLDLFYIKIPRALRFRDKISMSNSIELRPSFLDDDLICSLFKLKNSHHYNNNYGKWLLRKKYSKILGKSLAFRNKQQIQTPQREWFRDKHAYFYENILKNSLIWDTKWIDREKFFNLYDLFLNQKYNNSFFIWKLINLHYWYKSYF